jgi:hypothetical protein
MRLRKGAMVMQRIRRIAEVFIVAVALVIVGGRMLDLQAETADAASPKILWISPSEFTPINHNTVWYNYGSDLYGIGNFTARIQLPAKRSLTGITAYYYDNSNPGDVCVSLLIEHAGLPLQSPTIPVLGLCSQGQQIANTSMSQTFAAYKLQPNDLAFVEVDLIGSPNVSVRSIAIQFK